MWPHSLCPLPWSRPTPPSLFAWNIARVFFPILFLPFAILPIAREILLKWILLDNVPVYTKLPLAFHLLPSTYEGFHNALQDPHSLVLSFHSYVSSCVVCSCPILFRSPLYPLPWSTSITLAGLWPLTLAAASVRNVCPTDFCKVGFFTSFRVFGQMLLFPHPT